ncbi:hypothetical protein NBRGN_045_00510 [Nocardia brasiliensis NBRC 14402]|uniref:hypothetical protein n=1 Tax=Nocardia brasiliensis TaxID=37326 RepID=UPI00045C514B|nr:hypothetical protein [Nocardia brasiliensis]ASF09850.1 hypothetical protein CEQ30_23605 [Nocardia brasiliensis]GAJ81951.1 hypothetical protein NBRGN_045_00510 [Nocardia brasiliensis NBRC 14402]SUB55075.1 Uncharacterised protein [Nocardia brasiliensis]
MSDMRDTPDRGVVSVRVCGSASHVGDLLGLLEHIGFDIETSGTYPARHSTRDVRVYASIAPRSVRPLRWLPQRTKGGERR